jgi:peptidoglycan/xylan/chitin deacetylase (PgdA/CDA1 family)
MRVPGLKALRRSGRWLRSRFVPGAVVLGYHRVAEPADDPFGLCVSPRNFAEQLEVIRAHANSRSLGELVHSATAGDLVKRTVAITFDDGYADLLDNAIPALQKAQLPATIFVISGLLGSVFWWDRLAKAFTDGSCGGRRRNGRSDLNGTHQRLRTLPCTQRERFLLALETRASGLSNATPGSITAAELSALAAEPLFEIGAHTRTHPWLPSLGPTEQREEIRKSRRELEQIAGRPVRAFSFPYGASTAALREEVRVAGYVLACDSREDVLTRRTDRFAVPRFWVPDLDGDAFTRWLRRWLHA